MNRIDIRNRNNELDSCNANLLIFRTSVLATVCMSRHRLGRPRLRARAVIEAEAGAFERWRLRPGDQLEVKE